MKMKKNKSMHTKTIFNQFWIFTEKTSQKKKNKRTMGALFMNIKLKQQQWHHIKSAEYVIQRQSLSSASRPSYPQDAAWSTQEFCTPVLYICFLYSCSVACCHQASS